MEELTEMQRDTADIAKQNTASATRIEMLEDTERKVLALQQAAVKASAKITELESKVCFRFLSARTAMQLLCVRVLTLRRGRSFRCSDIHVFMFMVDQWSTA